MKKSYTESEYSGNRHCGQYFEDYSLRDPSPIDLATVLEPLIAHLQRYDSLRHKLQKHGGTTGDLARVTKLLMKNIQLNSLFGEAEVTLADRIEERR